MSLLKRGFCNNLVYKHNKLSIYQLYKLPEIEFIKTLIIVG